MAVGMAMPVSVIMVVVFCYLSLSICLPVAQVTLTMKK